MAAAVSASLSVFLNPYIKTEHVEQDQKPMDTIYNKISKKVSLKAPQIQESGGKPETAKFSPWFYNHRQDQVTVSSDIFQG